MKRIVALLMCLVLSPAYLIGCANYDKEFTQKNYTAEAGQITEVSIDVRDRQIEVTQSADQKIHISYFENAKEYYDISISDGHSLMMTAKSDKVWTDYIGGKTAPDSRKISLQLPSGLLGTLKASTTNEDISLSVLTPFKDLSLSSHGGDILFDKLDVGDSISLDAKNGNIEGTIIGSYDDYSIFCDIKKGKSNLPSRKENGVKILTVSNNNGDIDMEFVRE